MNQLEPLDFWDCFVLKNGNLGLVETKSQFTDFNGRSLNVEIEPNFLVYIPGLVPHRSSSTIVLVVSMVP